MTTIKAIASDGRTQTALTKRHTQEMATERVRPLARKRNEKESDMYTRAGTYYMHEHVVCSTIMSLSITYVYGSLSFSVVPYYYFRVQRLPTRAYTTQHSKHFNQIIHWIQIHCEWHACRTHKCGPSDYCYYQFAEKKREIKIEFAAVCQPISELGDKLATLLPVPAIVTAPSRPSLIYVE